MKLRHKILTAIFLISVFLILPIFGTGAMWIRHVALLPGTAVVFPSDAAAMDRFMAAALKPYYGDRVGICNGVNDHVEIQAALDAVRDVKLSVGQFNCEVTIDIDNSNQALRGCGRNTILTTSTADLIFLSAVGGDGTEKIGIVIADMQIDGGAGTLGDIGIYLRYVDYSLIQNIYSRRHNPGLGRGNGIYLWSSDHNIINENMCTENYVGIHLYDSMDNHITNNQCCTNENDGIYLDYSSYNIVSGNTCKAASGGDGLALDSDCNYNIIEHNTLKENHVHGIALYSNNDHNIITNNLCIANSQQTNNTYDDIYIAGSSYNSIQGNICRAGALANVPRYGINIFNAACDGNLVANNDLYDDGFGTAPFNDAGTLTRFGDWILAGKACRLPMEQFRKGGTAPTETIRGEVAGFLFDADNEVIHIQFCVSVDWNGASDLTLILHCVLNADETADDLIDWETSVISVADHEDVDTAGAQTPGVNHDIGAFNSAGILHMVPIVLDYDDGTCPINYGDNVSIELSRTANVGNADYVAGVIVNDICLVYDM